MRCWRSAGSVLLLGLLAGCASERMNTTTYSSPIRTQSAACQLYAQAWVEHFRASVAVREGRHGDSALHKQAQARARLDQQQIDEDCYKPYCLIQPKAEGRLDTYCGYKVPDTSGQELYRWIPWTDLN
ncbi:hypothetical protein [Pseudomonas sp. TTU2014-080ASC]|uniref:hypothetical protein n=1 Tax=Pseudomonas sp. TTU2014-080ASC TaxID=1729724 RepID=UPI0007184BA6|nr:hypothetical protein [Pseudomonas sp. TTU2014-080ASC]KRW60953.1 hypothetical protein AO726_06320 [Pseudomonas sp. TTU2014-080ASC]